MSIDKLELVHDGVFRLADIPGKHFPSEKTEGASYTEHVLWRVSPTHIMVLWVYGPRVYHAHVVPWVGELPDSLQALDRVRADRREFIHEDLLAVISMALEPVTQQVTITPPEDHPHAP